MKLILCLCLAALTATAQPIVIEGFTNQVQLTTLTNGDLYANGVKVLLDGKTNNGATFTNLHRAQIVDLGDADTNSILRSGSYAYFTTNVFNTTNTVRRTLITGVTNPASMTYTVTTGSTSPWWAWTGTTNWNLGTITTTGVVDISFFDTDLGSFGTPINPVISNITVYVMERPDLFGA